MKPTKEEIEKAKHWLETNCDALDEYGDRKSWTPQIRTILAALADAQKDCERYRWLRDHNNTWREDIEPVIMRDGDMLAEDKLDSAIDEAMKS